MSKDGHIVVHFAEPIQVPFFFQNQKSENKTSRLLEEINDNYESFDFTSKIFESKIVLNSDVSIDLIDYQLEIAEWKTNSIKLRVKFENPTLMSRGKVNDKFMVKVRQHEFIVDSKTGDPAPKSV